MRAAAVVGLFVMVCALSTTVCSAETSLLEKTAGISASAQLAPIDLSAAADALKRIEHKNAYRLMGLVALDGYDESHDVHVYVTITGEIIAYYPNNEPASKIVDWMGYRGGRISLSGSKLEDAMAKVCSAIDQELPPVTYADFRHPDAGTIKILADVQGAVARKILKYRMPPPDTILDASWSSAVYVDGNRVGKDSVFCLDGNEIYRHSNPPVGWQIVHAALDKHLFGNTGDHEMDIYNLHQNHHSFAAIVLVCKN